MATRQTSGSTQRKRSTANGSGSKPRTSGTTRKPTSGTARKTTSRPARATGSGSAQRTRSANRAPQRATTASQSGSGVVGSIKAVASKAKGPAVAVGATAVGVAGGLVLKSRQQRKTVLGVKVPRKPSVDIASIAKSVGKASEQVGKTSKTLSKDMERVGDSAERIGKLLS
jgi:hypothetical protein